MFEILTEIIKFYLFIIPDYVKLYVFLSKDDSPHDAIGGQSISAISSHPVICSGCLKAYMRRPRQVSKSFIFLIFMVASDRIASEKCH
jgi:hypothetical protein